MDRNNWSPIAYSRVISRNDMEDSHTPTLQEIDLSCLPSDRPASADEVDTRWFRRWGAALNPGKQAPRSGGILRGVNEMPSVGHSTWLGGPLTTAPDGLLSH